MRKYRRAVRRHWTGYIHLGGTMPHIPRRRCSKFPAADLHVARLALHPLASGFFKDVRRSVLVIATELQIYGPVSTDATGSLIEAQSTRIETAVLEIGNSLREPS